MHNDAILWCSEGEDWRDAETSLPVAALDDANAPRVSSSSGRFVVEWSDDQRHWHVVDEAAAPKKNDGTTNQPTKRSPYCLPTPYAGPRVDGGCSDTWLVLRDRGDTPGSSSKWTRPTCSPPDDWLRPVQSEAKVTSPRRDGGKEEEEEDKK